jgi:PAS domain S-box-containing protein
MQLHNKKTLHENELLTALCNSMKDGAAVVKMPEREIEFCNKAWLDMFNGGAADSTGSKMLGKIRKHPLKPEDIKALDKLVAEKGFYTEEVEYISLEGNGFWGELNVQLLEQGGFNYYLVTVEKIDRSKKAERLIVEEERRFAALFEFASMGILIVNAGGEIISANPFGLMLFGYSAAEMINQKIELLIPKKHHPKHESYRESYVHNPKSRPMGVGMDLFAVKKDGTEFPVDVSLSYYETSNEKYVIAFVSDITIRKNAEAEIKKLNDELEATVQQRTRSLMETMQQLEKAITFQKAILINAGAMIISADKDGIVQTFNPEAEREIGFTADELIGKKTLLIFHDEAEIMERAKALSNELEKKIKAGIDVFFAKADLGIPNEYEWTYIRKDGGSFPVLLNVSAMKDEQNEITGYLGVALNISESKKTEKELIESLQKEKELNELKSRFVSMASHEFRTPLSTVLSSAYLIEKYTNTDDQPKRERHLQRIVSSVSMLTDILNDFLSLGKIEEGKIQVRPANFNIKELVEAVTGEIKHNLKKEQLIKYQHTGGMEVLLDASLLKHIIMNLVSNAGKFSRDTGVVEIKTLCSSGQIILSVKDHGIGISKEDQKHLMERFFRGTNAVNIQGTGLGLHLVSKYAELMNGTVECRSELEKGTEFIITFKIKPTDDEKNSADRRQ